MSYWSVCAGSLQLLEQLQYALIFILQLCGKGTSEATLRHHEYRQLMFYGKVKAAQAQY